MKRIPARVSPVFVSAIAVGLLVSLASTARAENHHHKRCSNATLSGSYGYYRTGPILDEGGGQVVAVGIWTFDGKGNTVGTESGNRNGDVELDLNFSGGYQVNEDCSGTLSNADGEFARLVVVNGGQSYYLFLYSNPVYLVATRIDGD